MVARSSVTYELCWSLSLSVSSASPSFFFLRLRASFARSSSPCSRASIARFSQVEASSSWSRCFFSSCFTEASDETTSWRAFFSSSDMSSMVCARTLAGSSALSMRELMFDFKARLKRSTIPMDPYLPVRGGRSADPKDRGTVRRACPEARTLRCRVVAER